ncbi:hypothetical protein [Jannaschia sp. 2305UL9-9]|uniref:hypothetical protein n=1 Tax=Jannaschia sp. 2305UL9-9 TaxID=3121638 RepID=UPI003526DED0
MLGWKLFVRALTLLLDNLGDALRVSALPYGAVIVLSVWVAGAYPSTLDPQSVTDGMTLSGGAAGATLLTVVLNLVVSLWVAVAWHRYVLLSERPAGWVPPVNGGAMLGYLGRSLLIGLLVGVAIVGISIPLGFLTLALPGGTLLVGAVSLFIGMIVFYRLAVVLPAGAIGRKMTLGEGMEATKGHTETVLVLALLTVGFSLLLQVPAMLDGTVGMISIVYQGVVGWIGLMLGVSTLTALYGHVVEGRPVE